MNDSVIFYRSFANAIKRLPPDEQLRALWAIIDYGLDGAEPECDGLYMVAYEMAKPQIDANVKRKINGAKGGKPKTYGYETVKPMVTENETYGYETVKPNVKEKVKVNVKVKEKEKEKEKDNREVHFVPPTLENVRGYCREHGYNVDAERFIDFYSSKGWMIGKNRMKDWKAAVRNWARQEKKQGNPCAQQGTKFNNFPQREYDFDELEKELLSD